MGFTVPHRHQSSTWLSRNRTCLAPEEHDREAFHLSGAIVMGHEYALVAGLCPEYWSVFDPPGWWKVMRCGCMFAAVPVAIEQNGQGVEERIESPAHHAQQLERQQSRVLPLDGSVTHSSHHRNGPDPSGPTEQRRAS